LQYIKLFRLVRQSCRSLSNVQLAGDHIGDQAGAVFVEEVDFIFGSGDGFVLWPHNSVGFYPIGHGRGKLSDSNRQIRHFSQRFKS
jgi:hypothetical protein